MTPLAQRLVRQAIGDPSDETIPDRDGLGTYLLEAHCFEISEIWAAARELSEDPKFVPDDLTASFLPAPLTWLEFKFFESRIGFLIIEKDGGFRLLRAMAACRGRQPGDGSPGRYDIIDRSEVKPGDESAFILTVLAMINTPKIIGRRQHMPHRGLEKRLLGKRPNIGKFPLKAWTEILLHITPPKDASADAATEAHLTGSKALHFCRAHLRIRLGHLERVRAHWRGDPSLGIKRSRYKVAA
ncbi:MAG: hypothetical protein E5V86_12835 [Mesorhizobium sp.]|nr:MAG: hypothetical protein E5V86_12835 [Mesorhizobium sp.]